MLPWRCAISDTHPAAGESASAPGFRTLAEALPQIVFQLGKDGGWTWVSRRWETLTGRPTADALGAGWRGAIHPGDQPAVSALLQSASPGEGVCRLQRPNETWSPFRIRVEAHRPDARPSFGTLAELEAQEGPEAGLRFRDLANSMPQLVWVADADGTVRYYNDRVREFQGFSRLSDGSWQWSPVLHPDDEARTVAAWRSALATGEPYVCEHRVRMADGSSRWHLSRAFRVTDPTGAHRWFGTATDIHALKTATEALRQSEERYRLVAEAINDAIWDLDITSGRLSWSSATTRHFGWTQGELGDRLEGWSERIHPDDRQAVLDSLDAALSGDATLWTAEYRFVRPDGAWRDFLDRGVIARDPGGRPFRMIGAMLDVTRQRQAERALRQSEAQFRELAAAMPQIVWIADGDGCVEYFNDRWYAYTRAAPADSTDAGWMRWLHPDDRPHTQDTWWRSVRSGEPYEVEYRLRRGADGAYAWFLARGAPMHGADGAVERWFGTCTEIEDLKRAQEGLREGHRRKDAFLAQLAHELRNPLTPLSFAVRVLGSIEPTPPALPEVRDIIERQVGHMARLVDDLLDVSRIVRNQVKLQVATHDLREIVGRIVEDYRAPIEAGGVHLSDHIPDRPLQVRGDSVRLAQIVGNLLHNARKFTAPGDRIEVRLDAEDGQAVVTVADTGVGIHPERLPQLFDPFSTAEPSVPDARGGLGLGLALVRGLVALHGGSVSAHSAGPGEGATFTIRLPLAPAQQGVDRGEPGPLAGPKPSVLIIEDSVDAAHTLEMVLTLSGHQVTVAFDGQSGIRLARSVRPAVVICDIGLPGSTDGYAVARALRTDPTTASIYLLALSGFGQDADRRRAREAGFDAHLVKPPDLDALERLLASVGR